MVVRITGADSASDVTHCVFGRTQVPAQDADLNSVRCLVPPAESSGTVSVTLSAGAGDLAGTMSYEYHEDVAVVGTVPSRGPLAGGTRVAVTGSNFRPDGLQCRFGSATAQSGDVRFVSTTMIECI